MCRGESRQWRHRLPRTSIRRANARQKPDHSGDCMEHISGNVAHTVDFMQGAITIIFALALGEALKLFVSGHEDSPILWDRLPALLAFLFVFFPFFQSMSQYLYLTYLNAPTA